MTESAPAAQEQSRRATVRVAVGTVVLFALLSVAQWAAWARVVDSEDDITTAWGVATGAAQIWLFEVAYGGLIGGVALLLHLHRRGWPTRLLIVAGTALLLAPPRVALLESVRGAPLDQEFDLVQGAIGAAAAVVSIGAAMLAGDVDRRERAERERQLEQERATRRAVDELQAEETRIRRMVADQLHGTLQHHLVVVTAGLDRLAADLRDVGQDGRAADAERWAEELSDIREADVRSLSQAVFPSGIELGVWEAIRVLLDRLPPTIATSVDVGPRLGELVAGHGSVLTIPERLIVVYTIEEAVTNALKHGRASTVHVLLEARPTSERGRWELEVVVDDDGTGLTGPVTEWHGLARHRSRIEGRGGQVTLEPGPERGARLRATLPFQHDPARDAARAVSA